MNVFTVKNHTGSPGKIHERKQKDTNMGNGLVEKRGMLTKVGGQKIRGFRRHCMCTTVKEQVQRK